MPQVHQHEGEVVEDIGSRHRLVELEAVEERRHAIDHDDVAQVKVAVTAAHVARALAFVEQRGVPPPRLARRVDKVIHRRIVEDLPGRGERFLVDAQNILDALRAVAFEVGRRFCPAVEAGDDAGETRDQRRSDFASHSHAIEQARLVEALHFKYRLDQFAISVQLQPAFRQPNESHHPPIDCWRGAAIEFEFALAHGEAAFRAAKVQVGQRHRLLHLPGQGGSEEHDGDVRLEFADRRAAIEPLQLGAQMGERGFVWMLVVHSAFRYGVPVPSQGRIRAVQSGETKQ